MRYPATTYMRPTQDSGGRDKLYEGYIQQWMNLDTG